MTEEKPKPRRIGILGGTGFVGTVLRSRLLKDGHSVKVLTRDAAPHALAAAQPYIELAEGDPADDAFLQNALADCDVAINLVGILNEKSHDGSEFRQVHTELPRRFARICRQIGVEQVLHMSALGASAASAPSHYLRSKGEGVNALKVELGDRVPWTLFCPSVIFGERDAFTNRFAGLLRFAPGLFPLACPSARMAPVHVQDVAEAFARCLANPAHCNQSFQLCGPREYSLQELVVFIARTSGHRRLVLGLPDWLSRLQAGLMEYVPGKPFSLDNYHSLQVDTICTDDQPGLAELGIKAAALEDVAPQYLGARPA